MDSPTATDGDRAQAQPPTPMPDHVPRGDVAPGDEDRAIGGRVPTGGRKFGRGKDWHQNPWQSLGVAHDVFHMVYRAANAQM